MSKVLENKYGSLGYNLHYKNMDADSAIPVFVLGGGYSSDRQMPTFLSCLNNGTKTFSGDSKSTLFFGDSRSFDEFQKDLNIDVSASGSIGLFSADLTASYARHIKDTSYTQSFYYSEKVLLPTEIFNPNDSGEKALNPFGKSAYEQGPDHFRAVCGDQLVQQNHLGASLYATLKVHFDSQDDKSTFTANAGAKYGNMFSVSTKISQVVSQHHIKGQLEVSALQIGGDVSQLAKIFSEGPNPYAVTSCSLEDLNSCQKTVNGVLAYAANVFPDQINFQNGRVLGNAASEGYTLMPLTHLGLKIGDSIITPEIESARKGLGDLYLDNQHEQVFITHILESPIFNSFFNNIKDEIEKTADDLNYNIKLLDNLDTGAMACYNTPEKCTHILSNMTQKLIPINENFIDQIRNSYNFDVSIQKCKLETNHRSCPPPSTKFDSCDDGLHGSSIAMPIDKEGNFRWDYLGHNNTLTILENNDGTISLGINGNPSYLEIQSTKQGQYEIEALCSNNQNHIPLPFNNECYCHLGSNHIYFGLADMTLQSIEDIF